MELTEQAIQAYAGQRRKMIEEQLSGTWYQGPFGDGGAKPGTKASFC